jgi:undecaprenyl-diphosphatase
LSWDRHLEHWIVGLRVGWLNWFFVGLSWIGTYGLVWIAIALLLALLWRRPSVFLTVVAVDAIADGLAELGKVIVQRHRPYEHQLGPATSSYSFPSGHATTSFACATVLTAFAPRWRVPFFVLATLIGLSRLYNGVHYPTDVVAGAFLGVLTALLLLAASPRLSRLMTR